MVRDRCGDHRHLQRRHLESLLAERESPWVDLKLGVLRPEQTPVVVETTRDHLAVGQLDRRQLVEAEPLHVVEDGAGADRLADVAEHGVDRVLESLEERHVPERLGRFGVAGVANFLSVLDAVARVVELRVRSELPRVQRGGRSNDLERGSWHVASCGCPVEEWSARSKGTNPTEVMLDRVRVV